MTETQMILDAEHTALTVPPLGEPLMEFADVRHMMMSAPVEAQQKMMAEYSSRRKSFRDWLKSQLREGVHFGVPPGCEPKVDKRGWFGVWNSKAGGFVYYPPEQYTPKPSLYQPGADFITDLMGLRVEFDADMDGWHQLGSQPGTFVYRCRLFSRRTNELLGEGRGARVVGKKGGDENNAIKMAKKCAKVDAVLTTYGLSDLFTQDLEHGIGPEPKDNPSQKPGAPAVQTRDQRPPTADEAYKAIMDLQPRWAACSHEPSDQTWEQFCELATGAKFDYRRSAAWVKDDRLARLQSRVIQLEGGSPPHEDRNLDLPF